MKPLKTLFVALIPLSFAVGRATNAKSSKARQSSASQVDRVRRINELAATMSSLSETHTLVDAMFHEFKDVIPSPWNSLRMRDRVAEAEYLSHATGQHLIPEVRVVDAWNGYAKSIGAASEASISIGELHDLRERHRFTSTFFWNHGNQSVWTIPSIYATDADGRLKSGCGAIESLLLLWDLSSNFDNLGKARPPLKDSVDIPSASTSAASYISFQSKPGSLNTVQLAEIAFRESYGADVLQQQRDHMISKILQPDLIVHASEAKRLAQ